ncbi:MAG: TlpA disulfide reductase family protein [Planctomycetota bacterium]
MSTLLALALFAPQDAPPPAVPLPDAPSLAVPLPSGVWRAWLDSPGGDLAFRLEIENEGNGLRAWLHTGDERTPASVVTAEGARATFVWGDYDSVLRAEICTGGTSLEGTWDKQASATERVCLGFHARYGEDARSVPPMPLLGPGHALQGVSGGTPVQGRYRVQFDGDDTPAVGLLRETATGEVQGTILTTLGDYRFLAGHRRGSDLTLSCFDGGHAFLLRARIDGDGRLQGRFWSGAGPGQTWSAELDDEVALPDPYELTHPKLHRLPGLTFPDLLGDSHRIDDPNLLGEACILLVFGSWCPNCHDATDALVDLSQRYRTRGLRVVGLACELTDDLERNRQVLQTYSRRHGVEWPILLVGSADKTQAAAALPFLDRIVAYPTVVFVDKRGNIRDVYTGFTGPAARREHQALVLDWRTRVEELLRD